MAKKTHYLQEKKSAEKDIYLFYILYHILVKTLLTKPEFSRHVRLTHL